MWFISFTALLFVAFMCVVGTLSRAYDANLFQKIGLAGLCFGVLSRLNEVWYFQAVQPELMIAHIGLASLAAGTAFKVYVRHVREKVRAIPWANTVNDWPEHDERDMRAVSGGSNQ